MNTKIVIHIPEGATKPSQIEETIDLGGNHYRLLIQSFIPVSQDMVDRFRVHIKEHRIENITIIE